MEYTAGIETTASPARLFGFVDDLTAYPAWLELVAKVEPAPAAVGDLGPAWNVELRARLGPLARSKRLRMVRTVHVTDRLAVFERVESDGRSHSPWVMTAEIEPNHTGASMKMSLRYDGVVAASLLEHLLAQEVDKATPRLKALAEAGPAPKPQDPPGA
jgi:hypothetical protein